ncbi:MAG TPA: fatty acyl-AMP ligase, partial [Thermoanaerobaculia bacterium]|nr:fatty acyl-AMP ligase [Thermoanaerobaculia bacterium]
MTGLTTPWIGEGSTLIELLRERARERPGHRLYTFLADGEEEAGVLSCGELDVRARALGALLRQVAAGEPVLLLFPPGAEFVTAFFGCLYGGAVAVPAYPPRARRVDSRLWSIFRDARPRVVLTTAAVLARLAEVRERSPELAAARWIAIDDPAEVPSGLADEWRDPGLEPGAVAFLQYTSGSTSSPKGVRVTHGNLLHNQALIQRAFRQTEESVVVGWLPLYHDMGLIGNVLQPLYSGARCVLMSPWAFLQSPARWLRAISRYRATTSGGPDFAYDLCVRKVRPEQRAGLDLSSWTVAFNGAEPVRAETLERFAAAFAPCGFRREALYPCYGLAEATLFVTGGAPGEPPATGPFEGRTLVASGRPDDASLEVAIVEPESLARRGEDEVGEIWLRGASVTGGYWSRPELTEASFQAATAEGDGPYLRTGDLGFLRGGDLYVAGRLKDLIIIRGRNHYPQ